MLASIVYTTGFIYTVLGVSAFLINVRGSINRLFSLLMGILATWSFTYSISLTRKHGFNLRSRSLGAYGVYCNASAPYKKRFSAASFFRGCLRPTIQKA